MKSFKLALLVLPCTILLMATVLVKFVEAQTTEEAVTTTVTIGSISVTLTPSTFDYGNLPLDTTKTSYSISSTNIAATVGPIETDLDIKGANTTGNIWTLASNTTVADTYIHKAGTSSALATEPSTYDKVLTTTYQTLATNVAISGTQYFALEITTPSSTSTGTATATVTVLASWAGL